MDIDVLWTTYQPILLAIGIKVIVGLGLLIVGFWLINWLTRTAERVMQKRAMDVSVMGFVTKFLGVGLKVLLILSIAGMFGVQTTSFIAVLSALTLAVGLALQGNLGHFASGILLLTFRPFRVGDVIATGGYTAVVKEIQIFHTILNAVDNRLIYIPNGKVLGDAIENLTSQGFRKLDLTFGIAYSDDIDLARSTIRSVVEQAPGILLDRDIDIFVRTLNDSSVDLGCRAWTASPDYWPALIYLNEHVKKALDANGLSIPFPQMDVHVVK